MKSGYGTIVEQRLIRFDTRTWDWAKKQDNLSLAVRRLIETQLISSPRGRQSTKTRYRFNLGEKSIQDTRGDKNG